MVATTGTMAARIRSLTPRQAEAVALTWHGYSNAEIARAMGCAEPTAHRHLRDAYARLGVDTPESADHGHRPRVLAAVALWRHLHLAGYGSGAAGRCNHKEGCP